MIVRYHLNYDKDTDYYLPEETYTVKGDTVDRPEDPEREGVPRRTRKLPLERPAAGARACKANIEQIKTLHYDDKYVNINTH